MGFLINYLFPLVMTTTTAPVPPSEHSIPYLKLGNATQIQKLSVISHAKWISRVIPVCWEPNSSGFNSFWASVVRDAAKSTWEKHSNLAFIGWDECLPDEIGPVGEPIPSGHGIRIRVDDEHPKVWGVGQELDGMKGGMVLNFELSHPDFEACQSMLHHCIRSIAVHEFGHALGFAHEQNRADAPRLCSESFKQGRQGDLDLTPYDKESVMNYCNEKWNNNGELSQSDVDGLQKWYGKPSCSVEVGEPYTIFFKHSWKVLAVADGQLESTAHVTQSTFEKGNLFQKWIFNGDARDGYIIINMGSDKLLSVLVDSNEDYAGMDSDESFDDAESGEEPLKKGKQFQQADFRPDYRTGGQHFYLLDHEGGCYLELNGVEGGLVMDAEEGEVGDGEDVVAWPLLNSANQQIKLVKTAE